MVAEIAKAQSTPVKVFIFFRLSDLQVAGEFIDQVTHTLTSDGRLHA